jgi:microcystin-dependent protein
VQKSTWLGFITLHVSCHNPKGIVTSHGMRFDMRFLRVPTLTTAIVLVNSICSQAQDRCIALLQNGIYNTYRTVSGNSNLSQAQAQFCSDYNSYKQSGVAGNLGVSYGLLSGNAGFSQSQVEAVGQAMCSSNFSYQTAQSMLNNFASIVDPGAISAFNTCVAVAAKGLQYSLSPSSSDPNTLTISAYYQAIGNSTPQHVDSVSIAQDGHLHAIQNVNCQGELFTKGNQAGGVVLDTQVLTMTCTRSGQTPSPDGFMYLGQKVYVAPVRIAVNTNVGAIIADMPLIPVAKPIPPETLVPVGTVVAYGGSVAPSGWMVCDGKAISRTDYPDLFAAIGIAHGSGDGVGTFNIPDYRGRFLRGVSTDDDARDPDRAKRDPAQTGGNAGAKVGSVEPDAVGQHRHWVANNVSMAGNTGSLEYTSNGSFNNTPGHFTDDKDGVDKNPTLGGETRPKNANVNFIIKVR